LNTQKQIFLIVVLFFMFVGACGAYAAIDLPVRATDQKKWHDSESIERGALLFANNCRTCHGNMGQGGVGLPLNIDTYKNQDPLVLKNNIAKLERTLQCGRAGTLMQPWLNTNGGALNERQLEHLVNLITAPGTEDSADLSDATGGLGTVTNKGWKEAEEFAHVLNAETSVVVGGETLDTIAKDHRIGVQDVLDLNPQWQENEVIKTGSNVKLPPTKNSPNGRSYHVTGGNETLGKIVDAQHVGAIMLAELNNIEYSYNADTNTLTLLENGSPISGLFPGQEIQLPEGAQYIVKSGDTVKSIADQHGLTENQVRSGANANVIKTNPDGSIIAENTLTLPANTKVKVQPGDTLATIARAHGIEVTDLVSANTGLTAETPVGAGQELNLPANPKYVVQKNDTLESIAARHTGVTAADLARQNNIDPNATLRPEVILQLPKVNAYSVKGDSLDDVAKTFSNVTAQTLGQANGIAADAVVRIGQNLKLPDDAWGTAPSDARNPGTACVQFAVPESTFSELPGVGTPAATATPPANVSQTVRIEAGPNDWVVVADGQKSEPNKGVVAVRTGTTIEFHSNTGLHTITVGGTKAGPDINTGDTEQVPFGTAGQFAITCDYHPAMHATVFVQQ